MDRDQALGALIFLVCAIIAVAYLVALIFPGVIVAYLKSTWTALTISVLVAFLAILAIGAWIGWTMATTPPLVQHQEGYIISWFSTKKAILLDLPSLS